MKNPDFFCIINVPIFLATTTILKSKKALFMSTGKSSNNPNEADKTAYLGCSWRPHFDTKIGLLRDYINSTVQN
jgi:hypothetical protein